MSSPSLFSIHASKLPPFLDLLSLSPSFPLLYASPSRLGRHWQSLGYAHVELLEED